MARRALNVYLDEDDPPALSGLADFLAFHSPKHHDPEVPSISALVSAIAKRQVFCLGPAGKSEFAWLQSSLEVIAAHPDTFCNGLPAGDREAALLFLGRVQKQVAWQLGESR